MIKTRKKKATKGDKRMMFGNLDIEQVTVLWYYNPYTDQKVNR